MTAARLRGTAGSGSPLVVIAALTYRRPDDLAQLLPSLVAQAESVPEQVEILIVDNDPEAGAEGQVRDFGQQVRYHHAAIPGIAAARNAALDASGDADILVFIDDDERPVEGWLRDLLSTWKKFECAAVVGPVISEFGAEPEEWVRAGRFFDRRRLPTGTVTGVAATNNLLLELSAVRPLGLRFDERFGLTGGSDTLFTKQLHAAGGTIVWCDEAIVLDIVPAERATRQWVLRRAYRTGNSWILTSLALEASAAGRLRVRARLLAQGLARLAGGAGKALAGLLLRRLDLRARGMRTAARGAGLVAGIAGGVYTEYRRSA
ncbi:MAG: putative glycosyltransferase [Naasia sp.]|uniref:glycosyltransferase family 2 protein n=1 Tax=Naasia sp. TaxID=2546198 RepID=UPI0026077C87|nr:glycosyltransferase [Naasia sp.]MCU1569996.1 putative glycosyltransferase [Naasia sp.]